MGERGNRVNKLDFGKFGYLECLTKMSHVWESYFQLLNELCGPGLYRHITGGRKRITDWKQNKSQCLGKGHIFRKHIYLFIHQLFTQPSFIKGAVLDVSGPW